MQTHRLIFDDHGFGAEDTDDLRNQPVTILREVTHNERETPERTFIVALAGELNGSLHPQGVAFEAMGSELYVEPVA